MSQTRRRMLAVGVSGIASLALTGVLNRILLIYDEGIRLASFTPRLSP